MSRQSAMLPDEIWSLSQARRFLQVSRTGIYELMKNDGLPYVQLGKYRKFDPRDVAVWWERKRRQQQIA